MTWIVFLIPAVIIGLVLFFKGKGAEQISAQDAAAYLRNGALVIDVRSPREFLAAHLPKAKNVPLDSIESLLPSLVRNKEQVLLLHCQSGVRSGLAQQKLKSMGYRNAFNLGSYGNAERLVAPEALVE